MVKDAENLSCKGDYSYLGAASGSHSQVKSFELQIAAHSRYRMGDLDQHSPDMRRTVFSDVPRA